MPLSALMPARSNSLFLTGRARFAARTFSASSTAYSTFGIVKLSRTSLCFGFAVAGSTAGAGALALAGAAALRAGAAGFADLAVAVVFRTILLFMGVPF